MKTILFSTNAANTLVNTELEKSRENLIIHLSNQKRQANQVSFLLWPSKWNCISAQGRHISNVKLEKFRNVIMQPVIVWDMLPELMPAFLNPNFTSASSRIARHSYSGAKEGTILLLFFIELKESKEATWENEREIGRKPPVQVLPSPSSSCLQYDRPINQCQVKG